MNSRALILGLLCASLAACERVPAPLHDQTLAQGLDSMDDCRFESTQPALFRLHPARSIVADTTWQMSRWPTCMSMDYTNVWLAADLDRRLRAAAGDMRRSDRPLPDYVPIEPLAHGYDDECRTSQLLRHGDDLVYVVWRGDELVELSSRNPGAARTLADLRTLSSSNLRVDLSAASVGDEVVIVASTRAGSRTFEGRLEGGRIVLDAARQHDYESGFARVCASQKRFQMFRSHSMYPWATLETLSRGPSESKWSEQLVLSTTWRPSHDVSFTSSGTTLYVAWVDQRFEQREGWSFINGNKPFVARSDDDGRTWGAGVCVGDPRDDDDDVGIVDDHAAEIALVLWNERLVLFCGLLQALGENTNWSIHARVLSPDLTRIHHLRAFPGKAVADAFLARMESALLH